MSSATTICGRSSEGRASLRRKTASVRMATSAGLSVTRGLANSVNGQGIAHRSDLTSARPSTPQTAPAGITCPASSLLIAAAVVFMSQKRASICDSHSRSGSLSGLKTAAHFPVECDLTTPRILRLTNPVTSPAASRRVVADGEKINQPTKECQ
jgi:hypothetical protein